MNKATPEQVKDAVTRNLKQRHLTQKEAGQMIGFSRQAVANLLANHEYFTEKQAILFSLAFGYDKNYLHSGEGSLLSNESQALIRESLEYKERLLSISRRANEVSRIVLNLVLVQGVDKCKSLISKTRQMHDFVATLNANPIFRADEMNGISSNIDYIDAAERIFNPLYEEIMHTCSTDFGVIREG